MHQTADRTQSELALRLVVRHRHLVCFSNLDQVFANAIVRDLYLIKAALQVLPG
jgi:hypothetical protein